MKSEENKTDLKNEFGFIYYENLKNGKIVFYLSSILCINKKASKEKEEILETFREILNKEYEFEIDSVKELVSIWSNESFIINNQFNNIVELAVNSTVMDLISLSENENYEKSIENIKLQEVEKSLTDEGSEDTPPRYYTLHPHADLVGCRTGISLGRFATREACNRAGRSRYGRNGSWCCVLN